MSNQEQAKARTRADRAELLFQEIETKLGLDPGSNKPLSSVDQFNLVGDEYETLARMWLTGVYTTTGCQHLTDEMIDARCFYYIKNHPWPLCLGALGSKELLETFLPGKALDLVFQNVGEQVYREMMTLLDWDLDRCGFR